LIWQLRILGADTSWNELWPVFVKSNFIKAC